MIDYGQFCTVARGAEVFGERWTPLVVRELLCGSTRFNDIRRGVPRMSATLLAQRLRKLEEIGVVKRVASGGAVAEYHLTGAGEELRPIVMALGHWGARWIGSRLKRGQLDVGFLMWDIRRFVHLDKFPKNRPVVIHFRFTDAGRRAPLVAGGRPGQRRPLPRRPGRRADAGRRIDGARAHRGVDRRPRRRRGGGGALGPRPRRGTRREGAVGLARPQRLRRDARRLPHAGGGLSRSPVPPPLPDSMRPLVPVAPGARIALGVAFFVLFVAVWAAATFGGLVSKTFLADPLSMVASGWTLLTKMGFAYDIGMTVWRVVGGFVIAAVLALPLGVAMGAYKPIEAFFEPFVSFARYLPASAFIPLLILWAGIGEAQKLAVIFIGSFFQLVLMIAVIVGNTRRDLVEAAYTLGVGDRGLIRRVLIPGAAPEIAEVLRTVLGWAWTYVIVAELIGASSGIGHMITDSQALLATDQIIFGIIVIGLIGLASDLLFKAVNRRLFPWAQLR